MPGFSSDLWGDYLENYQQGEVDFVTALGDGSIVSPENIDNIGQLQQQGATRGINASKRTRSRYGGYLSRGQKDFIAKERERLVSSSGSSGKNTGRRGLYAIQDAGLNAINDISNQEANTILNNQANIAGLERQRDQIGRQRKYGALGLGVSLFSSFFLGF